MARSVLLTMLLLSIFTLSYADSLTNCVEETMRATGKPREKVEEVCRETLREMRGESRCAVVNYETYPGTIDVEYMSVTIKNISDQMIRVQPKDISIKTIKGNIVQAERGETADLNPGETKKISGIGRRKLISQVVSVSCK